MKSLLFVFTILFAGFRHYENPVADNTYLQPACYEGRFEIENKHLQKSIGAYIGKISDEELPIVVIQRKEDSLLTYISATMSTKFLVKKHPSYLAKINGRYVAVYSEKQIGAKSNECLMQVVGHYKEKLRFDKINTKNGTDNAEAGFGYDPIRIKIGIVADNVVLVDEHYPYFKSIPVIE